MGQPRLQVLDNYKEISRIMTHNYLQQAQSPKASSPLVPPVKHSKDFADLLVKLSSSNNFPAPADFNSTLRQEDMRNKLVIKQLKRN